MQYTKHLDKFHIYFEQNRIEQKVNWFGIPVLKNPFDLMIFQELIFELKPDFIIETGTGFGGSAVFYANILRTLNHGQVITVDTEKRICAENEYAQNLILERVNELTGDSVSSSVFDKIASIVGNNKKCIVFLDSWHCKEHVLKELELYNQFVNVGSYIIVEDTHVSNHPVPWQWGEGPFEATTEFLKKNKNFVADTSREKLLFTFNPGGFLKRIK